MGSQSGETEMAVPLEMGQIQLDLRHIRMLDEDQLAYAAGQGHPHPQRS